jgi:hypothetical protein
MDDKLTPIQVFLSCFTVASLGGFFSHLRSKKPLSLRNTIALTFYSGLVGLVIGLLWYNYFAPGNLYFLIGVSGLAGLGGTTLLDVVVNVISKGGVNIMFTPQGDDEGETK